MIVVWSDSVYDKCLYAFCPYIMYLSIYPAPLPSPSPQDNVDAMVVKQEHYCWELKISNFYSILMRFGDFFSARFRKFRLSTAV